MGVPPNVWRLFVANGATFRSRWGNFSPSISQAIAIQTRQTPGIDGYCISHNVYYVTGKIATQEARASPVLMLSAANLGQLARQLVAIDALSYVQSQ